MDDKMNGLTLPNIQVDEMWGFIGAEAKTAKANDMANDMGTRATFGCGWQSTRAPSWFPVSTSASGTATTPETSLVILPLVSFRVL